MAGSWRYGNLRNRNVSDVVLAEYEMIADGKPRDYEQVFWLDKSYVPKVSFVNGPINFYYQALSFITI